MSANGCGPEGWGWLVPDGPKQLFKKPCNDHDDRYEIGGTEPDRIEADWILFKDCLASLKNERWYIRYPWSALSILYLLSVLFLGWLRFKYKVQK
jgi:hypothetical protein